MHLSYWRLCYLQVVLFIMHLSYWLMLGLLLIYKAITVLITIKFTKMALVKMYLTIGSVKIRFLGYTPKIFSQWPHADAALWGLTFHTL